ncbi:hypothetical protein GXB78_04665 [Pseudomonas moraviensis subsp. stanleyae]|uniref:hypothetical protein n=1 Tax=Pseudomonas moraviensis TaxID=321662 RepID=UPI002E33CF3A|nr:hypothetical protein [Pseudomonas moraviensis]MED7666506.1 hypothetical protein [Pseudomonas moraviensis subsp. stanleyae]
MEKTQPDNAVMTLYPVHIPRGTENVITDPPAEPPVVAYGLPLAVFTEITRGKTTAAGVQVVVDPPFNVGQYDTISLFINDVPSGVPRDVDDERMVFNVFQSEFVDGVNNVIHYVLKPISGNDSKSIEAWARYNDTLPGGNNVPGTGDHPALLISLPEGLGNPAVIDKDEAAKGVLLTFNYPYCRAYDLVTFEINRQRFTHKVTPEEAGKAFSVMIAPAMFQQIGSLDKCPFSYTVVDQLLNSTHQRRWSKAIFANIDLERNFLPQPILREDPDDDMDDPAIVDLDKLDGRPLLIVIVPTAPDFQKGDTVKGFYRLDEAAEKPTQPGVITDKFGALQPCILEIPNDQLTSGARLLVRFEQERPSGTVIGHSRTAEAEVIGQAAPDLVAPIIKQAPGNSLDPFAAKDELTALVFDPSIQVDDIIVVTWTGAPGTPADGSYTSPPHVVKVLGTQQIALDNKVLAHNFGQTSTVKYRKTTGSDTRGSLPLTLSVQDIADGDPRLPTPTIDRVTGDVLDPANLLPTDQTRTTAWALIALGQKLSLTYKETKRDGSTGIVVEAYKGKEVTAEDLGGIRHPVPLDKLLMLEEDSTLEIEVKVSFDKTESGCRSLPKKVYTIEKPYDDLTTFTNYETNDWKIINAVGSIIKQDNEYFAQSISGGGAHLLHLLKSYQHLQSGRSCTLSFDHRNATKHYFLLRMMAENSITEINIGYTILPPTSTWKSFNIKFYLGLPETNLFSIVLIACQGDSAIALDNIRLTSTN